MRLANAVAGLGAAAFLAAQQPNTIRVPVRLVTVPTLVFSAENRLIPDLRKSDFRVFDNGGLQSIALETSSSPVSVAVAVQVNQDVRSYIPFISKVGSALETLLVGESGEAAVIAYNGDIALVKPFG